MKGTQNPVLSDIRPLHLIKASAGSGKTHRLTGEYLKLLFSNDSGYKHILAVTFTNKATDEMKSRILEELHNLASGYKSDYLSSLMSEFSMIEERVRSLAKTILGNILHDYSSFSISTIDRFFQQTMRAFTREMGISGGYNVEVDGSLLLMQAIDLMLADLDKPENKSLSKWLLSFMEDQIESGKSWNIEKQVNELAKELFNEKYKSFTTEEKLNIEDKSFLEGYKLKLTRIKNAYETELKSIGTRGVEIMSRSGIIYSDFKGGSRSAFSRFANWANGDMMGPSATFISLADNVDGWYTKSVKPEIKSAIESCYNLGLNDCIKEAISHFENNINYLTSICILKNFYTLGILNDIKTRLQKLQQESNTLLLSDTTALLKNIISDSDTPFIYEKTGTRLKHYMIDEFQDTSAMQWDNFRPLIRESLSYNDFNLIVGDVKQSIYRWRNSDWRLLEEKVPKEFTPETIQTHILNTNWRSDAKIIEFNNSFFINAARLLQDEFNGSLVNIKSEVFKEYLSTRIIDAYTDVYQSIPDSKRSSEGLVKISFISTEDKETKWQDNVLELLPKEIESLQDKGFKLKDIAILVRKKDEAIRVSEALLKYKEDHPNSKYRYDIISNEALIIGNAPSVKAAIALLRHFRNKEDATLKMLAVYEFYRFHYSASTNVPNRSDSFMASSSGSVIANNNTDIASSDSDMINPDPSIVNHDLVKSNPDPDPVISDPSRVNKDTSIDNSDSGINISDQSKISPAPDPVSSGSSRVSYDPSLINYEFPASIKNKIEEISTLPLYEMIEAFFAISNDTQSEKDTAYVQAFLDIALKFSSDSSSDINNFLDWWDDKGCQKSLFSPEDQDAIRLITIHKSKGLGFGVVIMPFVDWKLDNLNHNNIIWCKPDIEPFSDLGVVPISYNKNLAGTIFNEDYQEERLFTFIDNLNILYVAFTRAKHRIIAFAPKPNMKKDDKSVINPIKDVSNLLWETIIHAGSVDLYKHSDKELSSLHEHLHPYDDKALLQSNEERYLQSNVDGEQLRSIEVKNQLLLKKENISIQSIEVNAQLKPNNENESFQSIEANAQLPYNEDYELFMFGSELAFSTSTPEKSEVSSFVTDRWQSIPFNNRLRLRLNSDGFFTDNGVRDYGTLMHEIISSIELKEDIDIAVDKKVQSGELSDIEKVQIKQKLMNSLSIPEVSDWYVGKYKVLNETQVLQPEFSISRPDRVMIGDNSVIIVDYKFGAVEEKKYLRQVRHYMQQIQRMGFEKVSGYIFYVTLGKVVGV